MVDNVRYFIGKSLSGHENWIEVEKEKLDRIRTAYHDITLGIYIEEKFDILLENYSEYENDLLSVAWKELIFTDSIHEKLTKDRELITRRIINLLCTGEMYISQCKGHIRKMSFCSESFKLKFENFCSELEIENFDYYLCRKLRNYALHYDLPVTMFTNRFRSIENDDGKYMMSCAIPIITVKNLSNDQKMKKVINEKLNSATEKIDLRPLIRNYIIAISKINLNTRIMIADEFGKHEKNIFDALDLINHDRKLDSSFYLIIQDQGTMNFTYDRISLQFLGRRKNFIEKNNVHENLLEYCATNQI